MQNLEPANSAAEIVNIDRIPSYGNRYVDPLMHRQQDKPIPDHHSFRYSCYS